MSFYLNIFTMKTLGENDSICKFLVPVNIAHYFLDISSKVLCLHINSIRYFLVANYYH